MFALWLFLDAPGKQKQKTKATTRTRNKIHIEEGVTTSQVVPPQSQHAPSITEEVKKLMELTRQMALHPSELAEQFEWPPCGEENRIARCILRRRRARKTIIGTAGRGAGGGR